ncbi:MAG: hypothetical protein L0Y79_09650 [Chlorobi bacterium]|nr:hypothetical protein [Chlorobiota bacterium]MCI0715737.1 hypothetical protein [Chlorobiota bacterium]
MTKFHHKYHPDLQKKLNALKFNQKFHLTLHNMGFETRKIFLGEKFDENGGISAIQFLICEGGGS